MFNFQSNKIADQSCSQLEGFSNLSPFRIKQIKSQIFPLTSPLLDRFGNLLQIWSVPEPKAIAVLQRSDGSIRYISSNKIRNPLSHCEDPVTFHNRLLIALNSRWDFVVKENDNIDLWPHLEAQGWRDVIPKFNQDITGVIRLARGKTREEMCGWFYQNGFQLKPSSTNHLPKIDIHMQSGEYAGTYQADDYEVIKNLLRQGGYIKAVNHKAVNDEIDKFIGRGLCFKHPSDKNNTTFNVDFSKERKDNNWGVEKKGGFHIDIKNDHCNKVKVSTKETYEANHQARKSGQPVRYVINISPPIPRPSKKIFEKTIHQTNLTDSYNKVHPNNPLPEKGMVGAKIGGVACSSDYIEGLFDTPESLFENEHFFCMKISEGKIPFTNNELQQIIRELAIGIYVYGAVPFFSLHFRQESADLFPVIHPAYEHTLVGRVISMLDYFMKGYLNGGVFSESFIDDWHKNPDWKAKNSSALEELIDFEQYCRQLEKEDQNYISLKTLKTMSFYLKEFNQEEGRESDSDLLSQFEEFQNSFRIIAKQKNKFKKNGNIFLIDTDFDIEYTIKPSKNYIDELEIYQRTHQNSPTSFNNLISVFEKMKTLIHDHMQKLPLCKNYFSMLSIIHFLSCYFLTLKKHRKIPYLSSIESQNQKGCPPLFPHLPITISDKESLYINFKKTIENILNAKKADWFQHYWCEGFFSEMYSNLYNSYLSKKNGQEFQPEKTLEIPDTFQEEIRKNILSHSSPLFKEFIENNGKTLLSNLVNQITLQFLDFFKNEIEKTFEWLLTTGLIVKIILKNVNESLLNTTVQITKPIPYKTIKIISQIDEKQIDKNKKIVGGCGLHLEKIELKDSKKIKHLRQVYWDKLFNLQSESWKIVQNLSTESAIFGLKIGDAPYELPDNYSWMEQFYFTPPDRKNIECKKTMVRIQHAMEAKDKNLFEELVNTANALELKKMQDHNHASLLIYAALNEDLFFLKTLLLHKLSPTEADKHGYLPIHYAAMNNNIPALEVLYDTAPDTLKSTNHNGATPLTIAILYSAKQAVEFCLKKGAAAVTMTDGYTDLHCALHVGNKEIIFKLLENDNLMLLDCLNVCCEEGGTPLMLACELDDPKIVQILIDKGANVIAKRRDGLSAIEIAIKRNCLSVLDVLLKKTMLSSTDIELAMRFGSIEIVDKIEKNTEGFSTYRNIFKDTPAHIAIRNGNLLAALYLADKFPNMFYKKNFEKQTALSLACLLNAWDIIAVLFNKHKILPNVFDLLRTNYHPLTEKILNELNFETEKFFEYIRFIARNGNRESLSYIFSYKNIIEKSETLKKINIINEIASIAAKNQNLDVLLFLLEWIKEQKLDLLNNFEFPQIFYAFLIAGNRKLIKYIISLYPQFINNSLDELETKPIHLVSKLGLEPILNFLISKGADIESRDKFFRTPLHYAIKMRHKDIIPCFLKKNACIEVKDFYEAAKKEDGILELLMHNQSTKKILEEALYEAIDQSDYPSFLNLQSKGAECGYKHLFHASRKGNPAILYKIVQDLSTKGPLYKTITTSEGDTALHLACKYGHFSCSKILIEAGFEKNQKNHQNKTAIDLSSNKKGLSTLLQSSIKGGIIIEKFIYALKQDDPNEIERLFSDFSENEIISFTFEDQMISGTPLLLAIRYLSNLKKDQIIKWVNTTSVDVNLPDENGETIAHILLKKGISPIGISNLNFSVYNHIGQTPLHLAAAFADEPVIHQLIKIVGKNGVNSVDNNGKTPIFYAINAKDEKKLSILIHNGASLDHYDQKMFTPLFYAISLKAQNIVKILINAGANLNNLGTLNRVSPLLFSLQNMQNEISRYLLLQGVSTTPSYPEGIAPIHLATNLEDIELLRLLSMNRQSLLLRDNDGKLAVHYAALHGKTEALSWICKLDEKAIHATIENPIKERKKNFEFLEKATPLHLAALSGTPSTVDWLLKHWANPEVLTKNAHYPLFFGLRSQAPNAMLDLFNPYKITDKIDNVLTSVIISICYDNLDAMKILYEKGIPINWELSEQGTGLHIASYYGALHCTAWLLQNGANPELTNKKEKNVFEIAASKRFHEQFQLLLIQGNANIHTSYTHGRTLLHKAALKGNINNVLVLLKMNANLNCIDNFGRTPLHYAVKNNHTNIARLLLALGADPYLKSKFDEIPKELATTESMKRLFHDFEIAKKQSAGSEFKLHLAIRIGDFFAVQLLIEYEDVNKMDYSGTTPLHLAIENELPEIVLLLLQNNAKAFLSDNKKQTPFDLALRKNSPIKEMLLRLLDKNHDWLSSFKLKL